MNHRGLLNERLFRGAQEIRREPIDGQVHQSQQPSFLLQIRQLTKLIQA